MAAAALASALEESADQVLTLVAPSLGVGAVLLSWPCEEQEHVLHARGLSPAPPADLPLHHSVAATLVEHGHEVMAVADLAAEANLLHGPLAQHHAMRACLAVPVTVPRADGSRTAVLHCLDHQPRVFSPQEQALACQLGKAIERAWADGVSREALREQALLYGLSQAEAAVGHWTLDLVQRRLDWSQEVYRIHGVTPQSYQPELASAIAFYHPDDAPLVHEKLERVIATGQADEFRLRILTPAGEERHVRATLRARNSAKLPASALFGTVADITEQVAIRRSLERQKLQLERVFNTASVRLWIKDAHNRVVALNTAAEAFCGVPREQAEGQSEDALFPRSAASHYAADLSALRDGPRLARMEYFCKADGTEGWVRTDRVPYLDPQTDEPRILLSSIDVTQDKRFEDELQARSQELRRLNQELEEFVYAASHDLRSPLRAIAHLSAWLEEDLGDDLPEQPTEHLRLMRSRVGRLDQLLTDLLAYSRAGRTRVQLEDIELEAMVRSTFDLLGLADRFTLETSGLQLRLRTAATPLEQALRNLMDNAAKHHDRERGVIRVSAVQRRGMVEFTVTDDGPGVPEEHHERIFRAFQTLRSRDEVESSGMGLAILKKLVEYAGGSISLDSKPSSGERGASFRFTWPLQWPLDTAQS